MNNKKLEALLYSAVGVVVMFLIIVAINVIVGSFRTRVDLTEGKLHTISPGTRAILRKLDSPVEIRFYCSRSEARMPSQLQTFAHHVEDLLEDFREISKGKIEIRKFDPKPDSEAEDLARLDGVEGQPLPNGDSIYLGLAISMEPAKVAIPFLPPNREALMEYDIVRAISQVMSTNKPTVGIMTSLPIFGQPANPMMARMGQQSQGQEPWVFLSELKRDFDVRQIQMDSEKIDDDIKVLLVIHPKDIKDTAQYALDQFVLRGGRLIAFVDALCLSDRSNQNPQMMGFNPGASSTLDKLFKAWGVNFDTSKVAADLNYARKLMGHNRQEQIIPTFMFVDRSGMDSKDVLTAQIDELLLPCPGAFSGTPAAGLKETVLVHSSTNSQLVDGFMANLSPQKVLDEFRPSGTRYPLAIRLTGKFKTAFPDGKPETAKTEKEGDEKKDEKKDTPKEPGLKEGKDESIVTLFGDADWVYDQFCARVQNVFGQKLVFPQFGNLTLCQAAVETSAGDQNLIAVRSRASLSRPFTVIRQKQSEANLRFQAVIKKLEDEKADVEKRLNELQQARKDNNQRFILSPEQQAEIAKFKQRQGEVGKELKRTRKELSQDIESLENRLKWTNIAGMPVIVTITGLVLAVLRKQRTKAK